MDHSASPPKTSSPRGLSAIGAFLLFGTVMASVAGTTLVKRGTPLDRLWALNPQAYRKLAPLGKPVGLLFLLLAVALAFAGAGWLKRRRWGWLLAVVIVGTQVLGDFVNLFFGRALQGIVGVTIAGSLLLYMVQPRVRATFAGKPKQLLKEFREVP